MCTWGKRYFRQISVGLFVILGSSSAAIIPNLILVASGPSSFSFESRSVSSPDSGSEVLGST